MACGFLSVQQTVGSNNYPQKNNNILPPRMTNKPKRDNNIMATESDQKFGNKNINNFSDDLPEGQVKGQSPNMNPGCPNSGLIYSQLVSDRPNNSKKTPEENKSITTTTKNNINSNITNSSSSGSSVSSSCKNSSCTNNSVLTTVTKVVTTSDEEQEAFLAEIDSDLPNFLTRTFMGQDARFSFILFFTVFSFSLVLGLFVIQASYAWHNYQLLEMLGREDFSEEFFYLHYYDPPEPLTDDTPSPGLRVNTSFYVH